MTDVLGICVTAADFIAPAIAMWFLVLRRKEDLLASALAVAGISTFLMPSLMFLLNRTFGYSLDRIGLTGLAAGLILWAIAWRRLLAPRLTVLSKVAVRLGRLIGGSSQEDHDEGNPPSI